MARTQKWNKAHTTSPYSKSRTSPKNSAWPTINDGPARYIGLRTWRYRPVTTSRSGGAMGAGVPRPWRAKRAKESSKTGSPAAISRAPSTRNPTKPTSGGATRQPEIQNGTNTTKVPGATTRNRTDPTTAAARCMGRAHFCSSFDLHVNVRVKATERKKLERRSSNAKRGHARDRWPRTTVRCARCTLIRVRATDPRAGCHRGVPIGGCTTCGASDTSQGARAWKSYVIPPFEKSFSEHALG